MKNIIALTAAITTLLYLIRFTYKTIDADGSWYNQLYLKHGRENVKFRHKLHHTFSSEKGRSLNYTRTLAVILGLPAAVYIIVRILIAGIINF